MQRAAQKEEKTKKEEEVKPDLSSTVKKKWYAFVLFFLELFILILIFHELYWLALFLEFVLVLVVIFCELH